VASKNLYVLSQTFSLKWMEEENRANPRLSGKYQLNGDVVSHP